jgi:hypothetical protein
MPTIKPVTPRPVAPAGAGADQNIATRGTFRSRKVKQASTGATPVARSRLPDDPLPKLPSKKAGGLRKVKRAFARVFSTRARASHSKPRESLRASAGETRITARPREENAPTYVNVFQGRQDIPEEEEYVDMSAGAQAGGAARQDDPIYDDPDVLLGRSKAPSGQASAYEEPVRTRSGASDEGEYMDMSAGGAAQQDDPIYDDPDVLLGRSKAPSGQASAGASDEGEYMEMSDAQAGGAARQGDSMAPRTKENTWICPEGHRRVVRSGRTIRLTKTPTSLWVAGQCPAPRTKENMWICLEGHRRVVRSGTAPRTKENMWICPEGHRRVVRSGRTIRLTKTPTPLWVAGQCR